jgi:hypothetical protein
LWLSRNSDFAENSSSGKLLRPVVYSAIAMSGFDDM